MDRQLLDALKQHHSYNTWRGRNTLDENLFIWRYFLSGDELPGWQPHSIQRIEAPEAPSSIQSIWRRLEGQTEALLRVDVFECTSQAAAHESLVQLLGEFQSPLIGRQEQSTVGDVAFADPGDAVVLFMRANLILLICNAGRDPVSVTDISSQFDSDLISKPGTVPGQIIPKIQRLQSRATESQVGVRVPLEVEVSDPLERPLMYKFFSRSGEVFLEEGRLTYQQTSAGSPEVTMYVMNPNRGVARRALRFIRNRT